ncbi:hypothetical protein CDCA_CDCA03G0920 [Cyanidium caldarium]|uniref:Uncharacterized protein n=1 Tax=Cyanidium caldarium TaxID=2771 RepID=A0AAV9IS32_CYACA|nr:hypothetical protein CDCA_CDCA03G0920 [Cyanidium caldarium]
MMSDAEQDFRRNEQSQALQRVGLADLYAEMRRARLPSTCAEYAAEGVSTEVPLRVRCAAGSLLEVALQLDAHAGLPISDFAADVLHAIHLDTAPDVPDPAWLGVSQPLEFASMLRARRRLLRKRERRRHRAAPLDAAPTTIRLTLPES